MSVHPNCHLIAVSGGKGGVGKSVFAANLAMTFLKEMKSQVLLIDLDKKSCGDQSIIMGLRPQKTVRDLIGLNQVMTQQNLKSIVSRHPTGLSYLAAVKDPEESLSGEAQIFKRQLYSISQFYKYIVVDLGREMDELQLSAIEGASVLLILTTPEILVVNQTKRLINELAAATVPGEIMQIILNKVERVGLSPQAIGTALKMPIIGQIPKDDISSLNALQKSTPFIVGSPNIPMASAYHELTRKLTGGVLQKLKSIAKPKGLRPKKSTPEKASQNTTSGRTSSSASNPLNRLKEQIHKELIREMDLKKDLTNSHGDVEKEKQLRSKTQQTVTSLVDRHGKNLQREERSEVIKQVLDEALGLGPLEELLKDPSVTEIMVNGSQKIYAEKKGKIILTPSGFTSNLQLRNVIERIVTPLGRRIDEKTPYVDARLHDGSRVNAVIEPLSIDGPSVTIRKFPSERITINDYTEKFGSLTKPMADFLRICVEQGLNIIISGGTGSGKTTLLNVISSFIPTNERIITVEDAAELQLKQDHVVRLETRPANMEGEGEVSIRDLIRNSLRMRPDRIIVGECRDGAALDMLSAMNTGHDGSMTTVHANNPREAISRLETLCLMAGMELPMKAIREQIAGAVNLIVQISRLSDGSRKIKSITEVVGMQGETVTLQEVFRFKEEGFDKNRKIIGQFQAMGLIPTFIEKFEQRGISVPRNLFTTSGATATTQDSGEKVNPRRPPLRRPTPMKSNVKPSIKSSASDGTTPPISPIKKKASGGSP